MSAPQQLVPTLVLIEDAGEWTVRVGDQPNAKQVSQAVVPLLAGLGARKLLLITPFDTKVYKFDSPANGATPHPPRAASPEPVRRVIADEGAPPTAEDATAEFEAFVKEEQEAERLRLEMARTNAAEVDLPQPEEAPAPVKRGRPPKDKVEAASSACGRCQGGGVLPGGGTCPVCRGKGVIAKYGGRRR